MKFGAPLPGAEAALPPDTIAAPRTNRERTAAATAAPACMACHTQLNPPGFAFEQYDAMGRYRLEDNGARVDASGSITLDGGETIAFSDGTDFAKKLAASARVRDCYATHWTRTAIGNEIAWDAPGLAPIRERFRKSDSVKELLVTIATSELFRLRRAGGAP